MQYIQKLTPPLDRREGDRKIEKRFDIPKMYKIDIRVCQCVVVAPRNVPRSVPSVVMLMCHPHIAVSRPREV